MQDIAQGRCDDPAGALHRLDARWSGFGVQWLEPYRTAAIGSDEWLRAPELALLIDRSRRDIYNWARLGHIEQRAGPDGTPEYAVASVINYQKTLTHRRRRSAGH